MKKNNLYILFSLIALALFLFLPAPKKEIAHKPSQINNPAPDIEAKAALAEDLLLGEVLFSKNSSEVLPLASITKIITLLAVFDKVAFGEEVAVSQAAVLTSEPSSLRVGEHFSARDLASMAMAESSNDATYALFEHTYIKNQITDELAEAWFLDSMRQKAEVLGAKSMNFYNITGLDVSKSASGTYGSVEDVMKIAQASLDSPIWQLGAVHEIVSKEGIKHKLKPTNKLGPELTPLVGSKTGYTDLAGGNLLVIVEYPIGRPLGIVVLGSSEEGRFEDVKKVLEWIKSQKPL